MPSVCHADPHPAAAMAALAEDAATSRAAPRRANRSRAPPTPDQATSRAAASARLRMRLASPAADAFSARCRETPGFRLRGPPQVMENPGRSGLTERDRNDETLTSCRADADGKCGGRRRVDGPGAADRLRSRQH